MLREGDFGRVGGVHHCGQVLAELLKVGHVIQFGGELSGIGDHLEVRAFGGQNGRRGQSDTGGEEIGFLVFLGEKGVNVLEVHGTGLSTEF